MIVVTGSTDPRWQGAIRTLTQRGVKAAVAMIDLESWGGRAGAAATAVELRALGVQVNLIRKGDHIPAVMVGQIPGGGRASGVAMSADTPGNGTNGASGAPAAQAHMQMEEALAETDWSNVDEPVESSSEGTAVP